MSSIVLQPLKPNEICVFYAFLDEIAQGDLNIEGMLSLDEILRAQRYVHKRDGKRFAIGRAVLRMILGRYLSIQPEAISFQHNEFGKPTLDGPDLYFNMSKSAGRATYAISRNRQIGVDIEHIRDIPQMDQIAQRFFSKSENELLNAQPDSTKKEFFFQLWSRKEALAKAVGTGLSKTYNTIDLTSGPSDPLRLLRLVDDSKKDRDWAVIDIGHKDGYASALAAEWPCVLPPQIYVFPLNFEDMF